MWTWLKLVLTIKHKFPGFNNPSVETLKPQTIPKQDSFPFHSRLLKIWRMERLRGLAGCVAVEHVAVVEGVGLPRPLLLGEVPAGGQLWLQNLGRRGSGNEGEDFLYRWRSRKETRTHPDFPQQIADDVEGWYPGGRGQRRVAAICNWQCCMWKRRSAQHCIGGSLYISFTCWSVSSINNAQRKVASSYLAGWRRRCPALCSAGWRGGTQTPER